MTRTRGRVWFVVPLSPTLIPNTIPREHLVYKLNSTGSRLLYILLVVVGV